MAATTLAGAFAQGVDASKPAASSSLEGYFYFSTDINGGTIYQCKSSAWVQLTTGVSAVKPNGLTGATAATRFAGGTTSSSPASGTFAKGDFIVDQTGAVWVCTVAGTPGTWVSASGGGVTSLTGTSNEITVSASTGAVTLSTPQAIGTGSTPTFGALVIGGLTGATAASRYVGAVASGAPASGTFAVGDFEIDQTGKVWICTGAGSPGTWVAVGVSDVKLLAETTVTGSVAASFDFTSIPSTYKHLLVRLQGRGDASATNVTVLAQLNADTGSHYYSMYADFYQSGFEETAESLAAATAYVGRIAGATAPSNCAGSVTLDIHNYTSTTFNKTLSARYGFKTSNSTSSTLPGIAFGSWDTTPAAINEVKLTLSSGNFAIGTICTLLGIN